MTTEERKFSVGDHPNFATPSWKPQTFIRCYDLEVDNNSDKASDLRTEVVRFLERLLFTVLLILNHIWLGVLVHGTCTSIYMHAYFKQVCTTVFFFFCVKTNNI